LLADTHDLVPFHTRITLVLAAVILVALTVPAASQAPSGLTSDQVRNAYVCLPSLADPPDQMVLFKDGQYNSPSIPFAEMRAMGSGSLNGKPAVVAEVVWNTGGSGNWEIVALFREEGGRAVNTGVYSPAADLPDGGTMVGRIEIRDNTVRLFGEDPLHRRTITTPLIVNASAFTACRLAKR
jgi:hypothetical protein